MNTTQRVLLPGLLALQLAGGVRAQDKPAPAEPATLANAIVAEVYEYDLGKAMGLYRRIAADARQTAAVRTQASLRLGKALRRLGEAADAEASFREAAKGEGAAAQEARAILAGTAQDDGDPVRAKVQQVLTAMRLSGEARTGDLEWIGAAAVPHVIKAVEAEKTDLTFIGNCAKVLYTIGGDAVVKWFEKTRASADVLRKRAVIRGLEKVGGYGDGARQAVAAFRRDRDPSVRLELIPLKLLTIGELIGMLEDEDAGVRGKALERVGFGWRQLQGQNLANLRALLPHLRGYQRQFHSYGIGGWLQEQSSWNPKVREIYFELLTLPCFGGNLNWRSLENGKVGSYVDEIRAAAQVLEPDSISGRCLRMALDDCIKTWTDPAALPAVLDIAARGYDNGWAGPWIQQHSGKDGAEAVAARLFELHPSSVERVSGWLAANGPPRVVLPRLIRAFEERRGSARDPRPAQAVLNAIVAVDSPESIEFVVGQVASDPWNNQWLLRTVSPAVRGVLQRLLGLEGEAFRGARTLAFEQLVFAYENPGEPALFAGAYRLGMNGIGLAALLQERRIGNGQTAKSVCSPANAVAITRACLATGLPRPFEDLLRALPSVDDPTILAAIGTALLKCPTQPDAKLRRKLVPAYLAQHEQGRLRAHYSPFVLAALADDDRVVRKDTLSYLRPDALRDEGVRRAVIRSTADADASCRRFAMERIREANLADPETLTAVEQRLLDPQERTAYVALEHLLQHDRARVARHIDRLLREAAPKSRFVAASFWLSEKKGDALAEVGPLLADEDGWNTDNLITKAGDLMDLRVVPYLLEAVKKEKTRAAAKQSLQTIRFYNEEKSRWEKVREGSGFSTTSPAEALIGQFNASRNGKVRIAAITSLGTLGDPESLPFLVKLIGDADQAIATAASAAVDKINSRPPAAKKQ